MAETVSLAASDGVRLACDVYHPEGEARGALVLAPGFWRRRKSPVMARLAEHLATEGWRVHVFDFRGHGDSEGAYTFGLEEPLDLAAALAFASERCPGLPIHVVGFSLGGSTAVRTLAERLDLKGHVRSLTTVGAPADFALIKIPLLKAREAIPQLSLHEAVRPPRISLKAYLAAKPRYTDFAGDVAPVPFRIVHTERDWLVDAEHARLLYDAAREPKFLHVLRGGEPLHADALARERFAELAALLEAAFMSR